ncbi:MAG: hypothetical protein HOO96_32675 [Polyangiaceae bacterium]|nr:hypothetical protein [Polyangiaceae bacterium]
MRKSLALAVFLVAGAAAADGNDAAAATLFDQGLAEMEASHYDAACPKLAESFHLDPRAGTLFTLAECEARGGKTASAVTHYGDYQARFERMTPQERVKQKERPAIAERQLAALRPRVPELTIKVRGSLPDGAVVKRDGVPLGAPSLGTSLPVDPGPHEVTIVLADGTMAKETFDLRDAEKKLVEIAPPSPRPGPPLARTATPPPAAPAPGGHLGLTVGAGALSVVGLGVGTVTGILTLGKKSTIDANCVGTTCNAAGKDAADASRTLGLVSTIGFIAGGAFAAAAVVLFITEPKGPRVSVGWNRVQLETSW